MNRLHGGKRIKWTRLKKWSAILTGAVLVALFVVLFVLPKNAYAATASWVNRYYITVDGKNYKDVNPFDAQYRYEQEGGVAGCPQYVTFTLTTAQQRLAMDPVLENLSFFFNDGRYGSWFTAAFTTVTPTKGLGGETICNGKAAPVTVGNLGARKVTFYEDTANKIHSIASGATFSKLTPNDNYLGVARYFRDDEIAAAANNSCPDMILRHEANVLQEGDIIFGSESTVTGSSMLFSVTKDDQLGRESESYDAATEPNNRTSTTCRVFADAMNKKRQGVYAQIESDNNADDQYITSTGLDANGIAGRGPDNKYEDDAFIIFIGTTANMPKDATGAIQDTAADAQAAANAAGTTNLTDNQTCKGGGMGWIICPIASAIQSGADLLSKAMQSFLTVNPLPVGSGPIYTSWNNIRNLSNIAFVLAFFAIIFSQATSIGISNYGIKRLLPRLVLIAIATNISYFLCSFLIDAFNILGVGVTTLFAIVNGGSAGTIDASTSTATGLIFGGGIATVVTFAIVSGAIVEIIPFIVAAFLALVVVFIVLVARQSLIILLVVFSPLAFVAALLPGTQQWFNRWMNLFVGMLVMYPIVMALFAAGRLASAILSAAGGS